VIKRFWIETLLLVFFLVATTALIAVSGADLAISSRFWIGGKWPVGDQLFWQLLYKLDRIPSIFLGTVGLIVFALSYLRCNCVRWRKPGAYLVLLLILGPGLLVNSVFKEQWGRPRPREVVEFSGNKQFLHPWQKGESGKGRSFPSGHSSAAFYMAAPYLIYRRTNRKRACCWLTGGILFGIIMSIARITQGAHFLSDTLWAFGMVALCALLLAALLRLEDEPRSLPASGDRI
jgi:membrane-associated PAP2 superfamily phosphatase